MFLPEVGGLSGNPECASTVAQLLPTGKSEAVLAGKAEGRGAAGIHSFMP